MLVSEVQLNELKGKNNIDVLEEPQEMQFDENGYLLPLKVVE
jgi:hypothetical protein